MTHKRNTLAEWCGWLVLALLALVMAVMIILLFVPFSFARDTTGLSAQLSPEVNDWAKSLRGKDGIPCCDDADGIDPEWDTHGDLYRVRYQGEWLDVDPDALLTEPNRMGVARAWIGFRDGRPFVRCFIPGPTI